MKIALSQVDGKWPNLALAKVAAWHKKAGDTVEWFNPMLHAKAQVWASKVFTDTPDNLYLPDDAYRGGAGYGMADGLPEFIEWESPDWSLWPWWPHDMGFTTRGCVRSCAFCSVREREGKLRVVADLEEILTGRHEVKLLDANLCAAPIDHFRRVFAAARRLGVVIDPTQGFDARLMTDEHAHIIVNSPTVDRLHIAFDNLSDEPHVRRAVRLLREAGMNVDHNLLVFVLVGFGSTEEEDLYRIETVREIGANPFVMPFDRNDEYQSRLARWANRAWFFRSCTWDQYRGSIKNRNLPIKGQQSLI